MVYKRKTGIIKKSQKMIFLIFVRPSPGTTGAPTRAYFSLFFGGAGNYYG